MPDRYKRAENWKVAKRFKEFKKIEKFCETCEKRLILNNMRDVERKKYCSKSCLGKGITKHRKVNWIYKDCPICGNEFTFYPSQKKKYCSRLCFAEKPLKTTLSHRGYILNWNRKTKQREYEHVQIVEAVLGRKMKKKEVVHHINLKKIDNKNSNLLVCDNVYHMWLHSQYALKFAQIFLGG